MHYFIAHHSTIPACCSHRVISSDLVFLLELVARDLKLMASEFHLPLSAFWMACLASAPAASHDTCCVQVTNHDSDEDSIAKLTGQRFLGTLAWQVPAAAAQVPKRLSKASRGEVLR